MAKLTLQDFGSSYVSYQALNANNTRIENALENTLSRDGTSPNQMEYSLDMNDNHILNLPEPVAPLDAVRLIDLENALAVEINGNGQAGSGTIALYLSSYDTIEAVDAAAQIVGGYVIVDKNYALTANFTPTAKGYIFVGGKITLGAFNFVATNKPAIVAPTAQIFIQNSTGRVTGTLLNPVIHVAWWNDGSGAINNYESFQAAITHVNGSLTKNNTVSLASFGVASYPMSQGVVSTGSDQPQIIGTTADSYPTPDTLNLILDPAPVSEQVIITCTSPGAPCGGSIRGFFFDGNSFTRGIEINNCIGMRLWDNSCSPTLGNLFYIHNTDGAFGENISIRSHVAGLGNGSTFLYCNPDTGTNSFSGLEIDMDVSLNAGARTTPVILFETGSAAYNMKLKCLLHNNSATNAILIRATNGGAFPCWFSEGEIRVESAVDGGNPLGYPVTIVDKSHKAVYWGGVGPVTHSGTNARDLIDYSNLIYCDTFAYTPSGVIQTSGTRVYQQLQTFVANAGVALTPISGGRNSCKYVGTVSNVSGAAYSASFVFETIVDQTGGVNGTAGNLLTSVNVDAGGVGAPTVAMNASKVPVLSAGGWPAANWRVDYAVIQQSDN